MSHFKLRVTNGRSHVVVKTFAGPDRDHLALCGVMTFEAGEREEFQERLTGRDRDALNSTIEVVGDNEEE